MIESDIERCNLVQTLSMLLKKWRTLKTKLSGTDIVCGT